MRSDTLKVPGATLYYEVRGDGPVLLLLPGSGGDAAVFDPIADTLAEHFTVVTLDPRGYSRSVLDSAEPVDQQVEVQRDDAYRLLETLTPAGEDAYVFGGSGGAVVALDLLAHHPERLRLVIAHEPPCFAVLPDAAAHKAFVDEVYTLFRTEGVAAAGARFLEGIGATMKPMPDPADLPPRTAEMIPRLHANAALMMAHELRAITSYLPDEPALAAHIDRLVLAAGLETRGHLPHRPAVTLADRLNIPLIEFPGGHSGFTDAPSEFAGQLLELLLAARAR
ncbi:pimeloyl-ACP methyl ester carboxylesterase [Nocardia tenerifensis]|uniref:Pimeloyl-ACP methyl ester carboxylesterase n=1 Tax=Nocardia tenerifensis TaxID=228006 RepID=A0A318K951_9NOCA|nr:alpha/beta hydrolase [Nocardia tenerifensis]PXX70828.1 pimeloyl-ACP methyl ester carboxylesterase [Nocardia tenerifensis]